MKKVTILGSTGSIGTQSLEVIRENPDKFTVEGLTCHSNISLLEKQIMAFSPKVVAVMDKEAAEKLRRKLDGSIQVLDGLDGLIKVSTESSCDILLTAVVGSIGLQPTYEAVKKGIDIALANKETLVMAGAIIMKAAKASGSQILPVDSEHSAIFQCLQGNDPNTVESITLTASGGSFLNKPLEALKNVTPEEALNHPNWDMGKKITIDSATMMNKGLEVIEAKWLFDLEPENINVLIHPESIIHSMVNYHDSSVMAQLGLPDMKLPIVYALNYPTRKHTNYSRLDLAKIGQLTFQEPDSDRFPALKLAYKALEIGHTMPVVLNTANEIFVDQFLKGKIEFLEIIEYVAKEMDKHDIIENPTIDDILMLEKQIREKFKN